MQRRSLLLFLHGVAAAAVSMVEPPEVAVCISGAARSFATVPVLRGLKRMVLQRPEYNAKAFAALSYDTTSPQPLDYNVTLLKGLSLPITVRRAVSHLKPELDPSNVAIYNTSEAAKQFRSCRASDSGTDTDVLALYGMQLVYTLVRRHELSRGDVKFDFVVRVRPDHLFMQPLPTSLRVNVSSWPTDRLLTSGTSGSNDVVSFAVAPGGALAATYFRTFTAAASCLYRERSGAETKAMLHISAIGGCSALPAWEHLARCVIRANLLMNGFPAVRYARRRPALLARVCNLNATTRGPNWPAWPMPAGETCVTVLDALKRPRAAINGFLLGAGSDLHAADTAWQVTLLIVALAALYAAYTFRERLAADAAALWEAALPMLQPYLDMARPYYEQASAMAAPYLEPVAAAYTSAKEAAYAKMSDFYGSDERMKRGAYAIPSAVDDDDD